MDRREFLKLIALGLSTSLYGCSFIDLELERIRKASKLIIENMVTLKTKLKYHDGGKDKISGEGLIVDDYIITCDHLVNLYGYNQRTPIGNIYIPRVSKSREVKLENQILESVFTDSKRDMAIFKLPNGYDKPEPVKLGDDDKLKLLDRLYLIGDAYDLSYVVRPGYLGKKEVITIKTYPRDTIGKLFTGRVVPGDSGSPILNSNGEVIGLASDSSGAYGLFKPINWYKQELS